MNKTKNKNNVKEVIIGLWNRLSAGLEKVEAKIQSMMEKGFRWLDNRRLEVGQRLSCTRGISTIEIILIIVVLIALIIIFRDRLMSVMNSIFDTITSESGSV